MNPLQAWQHWQENCESPDNYINFGFYSLVAAACERRVWLTTSRGPVYPNLYTVLVGPAGVGKGQVIKPVIEILREFKKPDTDTSIEGLNDDVQGIAKLFNLNPKGMRVPVGPESATLAALLNIMPSLTRPMTFNSKPSCYTAIFLGLEELTTLVNGEDVVKDFLLAAYDCGHFRRELKCSRPVTIINMCLNFLAGTTPDTFREVMGTRCLTDGFTSRTWFIYADKKRKFCMADALTDSMLLARGEVVRFIQKIVDLSGALELDPEAFSYIKSWYETVFPFSRANSNPLLDEYYARKNLHTYKLAIVLKLIDEPWISPIRKCHIERALEILGSEELNMDKALSTKIRNELAPILRKVILWIAKERAVKPGAILKQFYNELQGVPEALQVIQDGCRHGKLMINKNLTISLKGAGEEPANETMALNLCNTNHDCWRVE